MQHVRHFLKDSRVRITLIVLIVSATLGVFTWYLITHPEIIGLVFSMHPAAIALLTLAYIGTILANAFVLGASLRMIGKRVGFIENASLTGYSSVVNFFGPLQSGPGFRAAYLKQRHGVSLGKFFYATIVLYGFFALINALIILVATILRAPSGFTAIIVITAVAGSILVTWLGLRYVPAVRRILRAIKVNDPNFWLIGLGALALSLCTASAYFVELIHVDTTTSFIQAIIYAAAANLALFVSLTPGAIGFRESFLLLTQQLHQVPGDVVLAASIIDRAFYVIFLLVLFLFLLAIGARSKLRKAKSS